MLDVPLARIRLSKRNIQWYALHYMATLLRIPSIQRIYVSSLRSNPNLSDQSLAGVPDRSSNVTRLELENTDLADFYFRELMRIPRALDTVLITKMFLYRAAYDWQNHHSLFEALSQHAESIQTFWLGDVGTDRLHFPLVIPALEGFGKFSKLRRLGLPAHWLIGRTEDRFNMRQHEWCNRDLIAEDAQFLRDCLRPYLDRLCVRCVWGSFLIVVWHLCQLVILRPASLKTILLEGDLNCLKMLVHLVKFVHLAQDRGIRLRLTDTRDPRFSPSFDSSLEEEPDDEPPFDLTDGLSAMFIPRRGTFSEVDDEAMWSPGGDFDGREVLMYHDTSHARGELITVEQLSKRMRLKEAQWWSFYKEEDADINNELRDEAEWYEKNCDIDARTDKITGKVAPLDEMVRIKRMASGCACPLCS